MSSSTSARIPGIGMPSIADYQIKEKVGQGAQGSVYRGLHLLTGGTTVAIKQIDIATLSEKEKKAALNEVRVLTHLKSDPHPYLMMFREAFVNEETLYIILDWCPQGTLHDKISKFRRRQEKKESSSPTVVSSLAGTGSSAPAAKWFTEDEVWAAMLSMASGLHHLHSRKILHRDLKPQNVFLLPEDSAASGGGGGNSCEVQLGDFGVSSVLDDRSKAETVVGTPYYLSPELCMGDKYTGKSDVWSLGVVLFLMANDKMPFQASNYAALIMRIVQKEAERQTFKFSPKIHKLALWMMQKEQKKRPSIEEVMLQEDCLKAAMRLDIKYPTSVLKEAQRRNVGAVPSAGLSTTTAKKKRPLSASSPKTNPKPVAAKEQLKQPASVVSKPIPEAKEATPTTVKTVMNRPVPPPTNPPAQVGGSAPPPISGSGGAPSALLPRQRAPSNGKGGGIDSRRVRNRNVPQRQQAPALGATAGGNNNGASTKPVASVGSSSRLVQPTKASQGHATRQTHNHNQAYNAQQDAVSGPEVKKGSAVKKFPTKRRDISDVEALPNFSESDEDGVGGLDEDDEYNPSPTRDDEDNDDDGVYEDIEAGEYLVEEGDDANKRKFITNKNGDPVTEDLDDTAYPPPVMSIVGIRPQSAHQASGYQTYREFLRLGSSQSSNRPSTSGTLGRCTPPGEEDAGGKKGSSTIPRPATQQVRNGTVPLEVVEERGLGKMETTFQDVEDPQEAALLLDNTATETMPAAAAAGGESSPAPPLRNCNSRSGVGYEVFEPMNPFPEEEDGLEADPQVETTRAQDGAEHDHSTLHVGDPAVGSDNVASGGVGSSTVLWKVGDDDESTTDCNPPPQGVQSWGGAKNNAANDGAGPTQPQDIVLAQHLDITRFTGTNASTMSTLTQQGQGTGQQMPLMQGRPRVTVASRRAKSQSPPPLTAGGVGAADVSLTPTEVLNTTLEINDACVSLLVDFQRQHGISVDILLAIIQELVSTEISACSQELKTFIKRSVGRDDDTLVNEILYVSFRYTMLRGGLKASPGSRETN